MTLDELRALAEPGRGGYRVFGGDYAQMAVTLEDAEFLYALVRLVKPAYVLEFGTGLGVSARFIGEALAGNAGGMLETVEPDRSLWPRAQELLFDLPAAICTNSAITPSRIPVSLGLVFVDSGYDRREHDIHEWLNGDYQGLVCVHDANRGYPELANHPGVLIPGVDGLWLGRAA